MATVATGAGLRSRLGRDVSGPVAEEPLGACRRVSATTTEACSMLAGCSTASQLRVLPRAETKRRTHSALAQMDEVGQAAFA